VSYYETLKIAAAEAVKVQARSYFDLKKQIDGIQKRLADEEVNAEKLRKRISELKLKAGQSLSDGEGSFEKFKTSLKKRAAELETSEEAIATVKNEILPAKKDALIYATRTLSHCLLAFCKSQKGPAEERLNELLDAVVGERDGFIDACEHVFFDYGLTLGPGRGGDVFPEARHERIDERRPGCRFVPLGARDRTWKKNPEKELTKS